MMFSLPFFCLQGFLWDGVMVLPPDLKVLASLMYQSLVTAAFGFVAWTTLLQRYGATALHSFIFLMPISGVGFGGLLLGEPVTTHIAAGLGLIVSGILIVHYRRRAATPIMPLGRQI